MGIRAKRRTQRNRRRRELEPIWAVRAKQIDKFLQDFESLWRQVQGNTITVKYSRGWYTLGKFRYRRSSMDKFYRALLAAAAYIELMDTDVC